MMMDNKIKATTVSSEDNQVKLVVDSRTILMAGWLQKMWEATTQDTDQKSLISITRASI